MRYSTATLKKIETILQESNYVIRYERGCFQSGWCLLQTKRVIVMNKFLGTEGRINAFLEMLPQLKIVPAMLTEESLKMYHETLTEIEMQQEALLLN